MSRAAPRRGRAETGAEAGAEAGAALSTQANVSRLAHAQLADRETSTQLILPEPQHPREHRPHAQLHRVRARARVSGAPAEIAALDAAEQPRQRRLQPQRRQRQPGSGGGGSGGGIGSGISAAG